MTREEALKKIMDGAERYNISEICNNQAEEFHQIINKIYDDIEKEFDSLFSVIKYTKDKDLIVTLIRQTQQQFKSKE